MNQTRKIVVEHDPVDRLPEVLRRGLEGVHDVTVTTEEAPGIETGAPEAAVPLTAFLGAGKGFCPEDEAARFIRQLRDE